MIDLFASESLPLLRRTGQVLVLQVDCIVPPGPWKEQGYRNTRWKGKLEGTKELGYGVYLVQLRILH
jgi:hypothetical protein